MTRYATTGPSQLALGERPIVVRAVDQMEDPDEVTTGGAHGWDTLFAFRAVERWPRAHHRVVVPDAAYNKAGVGALFALAYRKGVRVIGEVVPAPRPNATPSERYRARNAVLLDHADVLIAGVRGLAFYRSGEWMTVNIAKQRGIPVHWQNIDDVRRGERLRAEAKGIPR